MATTVTDSTGDVVMGGEDQRAAAVVESKPEPLFQGGRGSKSAAE